MSDESLTREERRSLALHAAIAERLRADPGPTLVRARATLERMQSAAPHARTLLAEWESLLARPMEELLQTLSGHDSRARELRHVTPFAGVLSASERAAVYRHFAASERVA